MTDTVRSHHTSRPIAGQKWKQRMPYTPIIQQILVSKVIDLQSHRDTDLKHVHHIADSLDELSQMHPIVVQYRGKTDDYVLHDGSHRVLAAKNKEHEHILAQVFPEETPSQHIRRCILETDFLNRIESWPVKARKLQELKTIHEACYPQTKHGKHDRTGESGPTKTPAFVDYLAQQSNGGKSTFAELLTFAKTLGGDLLTQIDSVGLPKSVAKNLCRLKDPEERTACVAELGRMKSSVSPGRKPHLKVAAALYNLKRQKRSETARKVQVSSKDVQIIHCRMETYTGIPPKSVDAIITDPLYHKKHVAQYGIAAEKSARVLKDGGFAAFYCGKLYLDQVMALLGEHLQFRSLVTVKHKQFFGNLGSTKIAADCKYILVYQTKGSDRDFHGKLMGVIEGTGQEKDHHEYQQSVSDLDNLIEAISQTEDTILDMFAGSGTTGVAAILKKRKIILLEEDQIDCDECHRRINQALAQRDQTQPEVALPLTQDQNLDDQDMMGKRMLA